MIVETLMSSDQIIKPIHKRDVITTTKTNNGVASSKKDNRVKYISLLYFLMSHKQTCIIMLYTVIIAVNMLKMNKNSLKCMETISWMQFNVAETEPSLQQQITLTVGWQHLEFKAKQNSKIPET